MTDCEQFRPNYDAYALDVLEGEERAAIEAHLERGCATCMAGIAEARAAVANLALAAPPAEPPASLRRELLERVQEPTRSWIPAWAWTAAAAILLFAGYSAYQTREMNRQLAEAREQLRTLQDRAAMLEIQRREWTQLRAVLGSPDTRRVELKAATPSSKLPEVRAYWHEQGGLVLTAANVPSPAEDRTYQLWVVPKKGMPISAGLFRPQNGQVLVVEAPPAAAIGDAAALAITDEPAGGRPQPTTSPIWVGQVR